MKNNKKKLNIDIKKYFNKEDIKFLKKYPRLFSLCKLYGIPYCFINRCYKRYIMSINDGKVITSLTKDGYYMNWFVYDIDQFCIALASYVIRTKDCSNFKYRKFTHGDVGLKISEMSGFSKYFKLYQ